MLMPIRVWIALGKIELRPVQLMPVSSIETQVSPSLPPEHGLGTKIIRNTYPGALRMVVLRRFRSCCTPFLLRHVGTAWIWDLGRSLVS